MRWAWKNWPDCSRPNAPNISASSSAELTRLVNHTCLIGFLLQDMGALGTPLMYAFRERERILDLFESSAARG